MQNKGDLAGITVVELATVLAGPAVGMFFAELGARVFKIEPPEGDVTRTWKLAQEPPDARVSAYFSAVNWGKTFETADLRTEEGRALVHSRLAEADILLVNFKPSAAERLGMDYATLAARYPRLIYGAITGYGDDSDRAGYDAVVQAEAGFMHLNATPGGPPQKLPVALMDLLAAHQLKEGLLLALYKRMQTGRGAYLSVSLIEAATAALANQAAAYLYAGVEPQPLGSEHPSIAPYGTVFTCKDGRALLLAVGNDRQFAALCAGLGLPVEARFATNPLRVRNREALKTTLAPAFLRFERDALLAVFLETGVPAGAVRTVSEALNAPENAALRLTADGISGLRTVAFSHPRLDLTPPE